MTDDDDDNPLLVQCGFCDAVFEAGPDNWVETGFSAVPEDQEDREEEGADDGGLLEAEGADTHDLLTMNEWDRKALGIDDAALAQMLAGATDVTTGAAPCCDACLKQMFGEEETP